MLVTVAICTRNRSASLARTLQSIERAKPVAGEWELLITDNGSTDGTAEVIAGFTGRLPIRSQSEPEPGLSYARNRAVNSAHGRYIVWTDDDVVVDRNWLCAYAAAFEHWPTADLFAGRITPVLEQPATPWFERVMPMLEGLLAARNMGDSAIPLLADNAHVPYGANCAVRTEAQRQFLFPLNRGPGRTHFGEETTAFMAMLRAGHQGRWIPESNVEHMIAPKRQSRAYIRWWYEALGRTVVWDGTEQLAGPYVFAAPRWLWRRALTREVLYRFNHVTASPEVWVKSLMELSLDRGRLRHFRSVASSSP